MTGHHTLYRSEQQDRMRIQCEFALDGFTDLVRLGYVKNSKAMEPLPLHTHPHCMEITCHLKGRQVYLVDAPGGRTGYDIAGGDVFVTYPGESHGSGEFREDVSHFYFLIVDIESDPDGFLGLSREESDWLRGRLLAQRPRRVAATQAITQAFAQMLRIYEREESTPLDARILKNLVFGLLLDILEGSPTEGRPKQSDMHEAARYIGEHLSDSLTIRQLSQRYGLSPSRFEAKFSACFGVPPIEYMLRKRIECAAHALLEQDKRVTDIAMELGFCSSSYFTKLFVRYTGMTPSAFRRQR